MKIVSVLNHKGGVGKTTFTGSTAQALALIGFRVLVIDNDNQHNLSAMLGCGVCVPNMHDVYKSTLEKAPTELLRSVHQTGLANLHMVTSCRDLRDADVQDVRFLKSCLLACGLDRFYDYVIIDNAPGLDKLQISAIHACQEIFVPTELKQFAVDGIVEMNAILRESFPGTAPITRIIPNFYRDTKRQNSYLADLQKRFPSIVTKTTIPIDSVFDECVNENKILFLHRFSSRGAAFYLKLVHELFSLDEKEVWEMVVKKRSDYRRVQAKERFDRFRPFDK